MGMGAGSAFAIRSGVHWPTSEGIAGELTVRSPVADCVCAASAWVARSDTGAGSGSAGSSDRGIRAGAVNGRFTAAEGVAGSGGGSPVAVAKPGTISTAAATTAKETESPASLTGVRIPFRRTSPAAG